METGLSVEAFDNLTIEEIEEVQRALGEKHDRQMRRDANLYALLCNVHRVGKRVWKPEDFVGKQSASVEGPEAEAAIRAYHAAVENGRRKRKPGITP